jgi:hypothetical protein
VTMHRATPPPTQPSTHEPSSICAHVPLVCCDGGAARPASATARSARTAGHTLVLFRRLAAKALPRQLTPHPRLPPCLPCIPNKASSVGIWQTHPLRSRHRRRECMAAPRELPPWPSPPVSKCHRGGKKTYGATLSLPLNSCRRGSHRPSAAAVVQVPGPQKLSSWQSLPVSSCCPGFPRPSASVVVAAPAPP